MSRNKKAKRMQEDEIPNSVLKMKQAKKKREKEEAKKNKRKNKQARRQAEKDSTENVKKKISRKKKIKKAIIIIILIIFVIIGIILAVSAYKWKKLATEMFNNENSIVVDTDGNTIAELRFRAKEIICRL